MIFLFPLPDDVLVLSVGLFAFLQGLLLQIHFRHIENDPALIKLILGRLKRDSLKQVGQCRLILDFRRMCSRPGLDFLEQVVVQATKVILTDYPGIIAGNAFQRLQVFRPDTFRSKFQNVYFRFQVGLLLRSDGQVRFADKDTQKLDSFGGTFHYRLVQLQLQVVTQICRHLIQYAVCFFEIRAQDDEIVGIAYIAYPLVPDKFVESAQIKIG